MIFHASHDLPVTPAQGTCSIALNFMQKINSVPSGRQLPGPERVEMDERVIGRGDGKAQKARGNPPKLSLKELITSNLLRNGIVLSSRFTISHEAMA